MSQAISSRVEEFWLYEREVDRREGDRLKAQHLALRARDFPLFDDNQIFDSNAPMPGMIIAWLIGENHAGFEAG